MDQLTIDLATATEQQLLIALRRDVMALSDALKAEFAELGSDLDRLIAIVQNDIPALREQITTLKGQVTGLEGDKAAALATIAAMEQQVADTERETLELVRGADAKIEAAAPEPEAPPSA